MANIGPPTVKVNGTTVGSRGNMNFVPAGNITISGSDVAGSDQVTLTITGSTSSVTSASGSLNADVTLTSANTFFDGPTCTVTAGTWFVFGQVTIQRVNTAGNDTIKLWDGTTNISSTSTPKLQANNDEATGSVSGIYTAAGSTTLRIAAATTAGISVRKIKAAVTNNGAGNTAGVISAIRLS